MGQQSAREAMQHVRLDKIKLDSMLDKDGPPLIDNQDHLKR
jgi:hypothetical protein